MLFLVGAFVGTSRGYDPVLGMGCRMVTGLPRGQSTWRWRCAIDLKRAVSCMHHRRRRIAPGAFVSDLVRERPSGKVRGRGNPQKSSLNKNHRMWPVSPYERDRRACGSVYRHTDFRSPCRLFVGGVSPQRSKRLYRRADRGQIPQFTGVSDPYEAPSKPELRVRTQDDPVQVSLDQLLAAVTEAIKR